MGEVLTPTSGPVVLERAPRHRPDHRLLTTEAVAGLLRVSPRTVRAWARQDRIPHVRLGARTLRFRWEDVERLLASSQREAGPPAGPRRTRGPIGGGAPGRGRRAPGVRGPSSSMSPAARLAPAKEADAVRVSRTFAARYPGTCWLCRGPFAVGDPIQRVEERGHVFYGHPHLPQELPEERADA